MRNYLTQLLIGITVVGLVAGCTQKPLQLGQGAANTSGVADEVEVNASNPGEECDVQKALVSGKTTIIEFWSPYCPPCMKIKPMIHEFAKRRGDVAVRSVNINRPDARGIDWGSPVARQYNLESVPQFKIYGPDKQLLREGRAATQEVIGMIESTLSKPQ